MSNYITIYRDKLTGKYQASRLSGMGNVFDDLSNAYSAVVSNIEQVVVPYWSNEASSVISSTVTKISDLTGWLSNADAAIAAGQVVYNQLVASGQVTVEDTKLTNGIVQKQADLVNRLQTIGNNIVSGQNTGADYNVVTISSNPADAPASNTLNVTTDLLSGVQKLGIIPIIVAGAAAIAITGTVVYEIYKLKNDSDQYNTYMQARATALAKGQPLPPLPPALAQYTKSSWLVWLLSGIVLTGGIGAYIYIKHFRHKTVYQNP